MDETVLHTKLDKLLEDTAATRANVGNLEKHINAVSSNQRATEAKLNGHLTEDNPHGAKAAESRESGIIKWLTLGLAAIGTLLHLSKAKVGG